MVLISRSVKAVIPAQRIVIPAKAGIHLLPTSHLPSSHSNIHNMDSRFRGNDDPCDALTKASPRFLFPATGGV